MIRNVTGTWLDGRMRLTVGLAMLGLLITASVGTAQMREIKLTASDGAAMDFFGAPVAIAGNTVAVGAHNDDDNGDDSGSVYIFTQSVGVWTETQKLTAADAAAGDWFGVSLAISGDTLLVGATRDDDGGEDAGSAYVFTRSGDAWSQQAKLTADDASAGDRFGSVSVHGDTAIIGAVGDEDAGYDTGAAYVFTRSDGIWTQRQKLTAADAGSGHRFGLPSLSEDVALIGAISDDSVEHDAGSAYVFTQSGGVWSQQQKLVSPNPTAGGQFGVVAISGDTAVIGAPDEKDVSGVAYVYTRSSNTWSLQAELTPDDAPTIKFGSSVAISGDLVVVGAPSDRDGGTGAGAAYLFTRTGDVWTQRVKLTGADTVEQDFFGERVAVDGKRVVCSAHGRDDLGDRSGAVYLFEWDHEVRFQTDGAPTDALSGDTHQFMTDGGDCAAVTAEPPVGYQFVQWSQEGGGAYDGCTDNPLVVENVTGDMTLTAVFEGQGPAAVESWLLY